MLKYFHNHFIKISLAMLAVVMIAAGGAIWSWRQTATALAENTQIAIVGWLWSSNYGFISLSNKNIPDSSVAYGIAQVGDELNGWGWSPYVGWVCFGSTCRNVDCSGKANCLVSNNTPDNSPISAQIKNSNDSTLSGWARVISLGDAGWIKLGASDAVSVSDKGVDCSNCELECSAQTKDASGNSVCTAYYKNLFKKCGICFTRTYFDSEYIPSANGTKIPSGRICSNCSNCVKILSRGDSSKARIGSYNVAVGGYQPNTPPSFWTAEQQAEFNSLSPALKAEYDSNSCKCYSCQTYGSAFVDVGDTQSITGWNWSGDQTKKLGLGWVAFNKVSFIYPWLQTEYGSIYAGNKISQLAQSNSNATYCIFAQSVNYRVKSGSSCSGSEQSVSGINSYNNAISKIDLTGLIATSTVSVSKIVYNKYGNRIISAGPSPMTDIASVVGNSPLNNSVFYIKGDAEINPGFKIQNGAGNIKGNGTIIVNGNLYIKGNFGYSDDPTPAKAGDLGSVAWIVKGDIIVDSNVTSAVGAFIALGSSGTCSYYTASNPSVRDCSSGSIDPYPKFKQTGYGIFFSSNSAKQLTVNGLVLARQFDLHRIYADAASGAERIIYDGRITVNPPPGLKDLFASLPVIRDFQY